MKQKFVIKDRLDGLNKVINQNRINKYAGAKLKKRNQEKVIWSIKAAGIKKCKEPIIISVIYFEKNKRRDPDNIMSSIKFILDAMVKAEIIKNDGWKNIEMIEQYWQLDKKNPRIEVTIYDKLRKKV